jgi:hypothetical protein
MALAMQPSMATHDDVMDIDIDMDIDDVGPVMEEDILEVWSIPKALEVDPYSLPGRRRTLIPALTSRYSRYHTSNIYGGSSPRATMAEDLCSRR